MTRPPPAVLLSAFSDEAAADKSLEVQFATAAALGLRHVTIRFVNLGHGVRNAVDLSDAELDQVARRANEYGLRVACLGSPIGKVKLRDVEDGTRNRYVEPRLYLRQNVARAIEAAQRLGTRLIRCFSFYPPPHLPPHEALAESAERLSDIAAACDRGGLTLGLEVEANLVGHSGTTMAELYRRVHSPALRLVFDAANLVVQGASTAQVLADYRQMREGLGWLHIKDYQPLAAPADPQENPARVDEEALDRFVPADQGAGGHAEIFRLLRDDLSRLNAGLTARGADGVLLDLEPHLKGGGQFGGFSGPDGLGIALRATCRLLDTAGIEYRLRDFASLQAERNQSPSVSG